MWRAKAIGAPAAFSTTLGIGRSVRIERPVGAALQASSYGPLCCVPANAALDVAEEVGCWNKCM